MFTLLINNQPLLPPPVGGGAGGEAAVVTEWQPVEFSCQLPDTAAGAVLELLVNDQRLEPFLRPHDPTWRWHWNPYNTVGRCTITLRAVWPAGQTTAQVATLAVIPRKIDQERYALLLADLQQVLHSLVYTLMGGAEGVTLQAMAVEQAHTLLEEYYRLFDARFAQLDQAVTRLARRPCSILRSTTRRVPIGQVRDLSRVTDRLVQDGCEARSNEPALPATVTEAGSVVTTDTYENRLLKRLLDELWRRARYFATIADTQLPPSPFQRLAERSRIVVQRLSELRALPFLADVGTLTAWHGPNHVLQRDPDYRQVYRFWQDLRRCPFITVESPLLDIPLHALPQLYEYWCVVQVVQALLDLPMVTVQRQRLVQAQHVIDAEPSNRPYTFTLLEDAPLLILTWRGLTLHLRYQPRYRPVPCGQPTAPDAELCTLDRHIRVPDLALEVMHDGQPPGVLVFDAKYRLDASGGVPADALADAYSYLGGIGLRSGARATHTALLLYPGQGAAEHYASGVGALPLLPGATAALGTWLHEVLASWQ